MLTWHPAGVVQGAARGHLAARTVFKSMQACFYKFGQEYMVIIDFWFEKRILAFCLTRIFESPTYDDSLETSKRKRSFFLPRLFKRLQIHLLNINRRTQHFNN